MLIYFLDFGRRRKLKGNFSFVLSCMNALQPKSPSTSRDVHDRSVDEASHDLHLINAMLLRTLRLIASLGPQLHTKS